MSSDQSSGHRWLPPDTQSRNPPYVPFIRALNTEAGSWFQPVLPWVATDELGREVIEPRPRDPKWRPSNRELDWLFLTERLQTQRLCNGMRSWETMFLGNPDAYTPETDIRGEPFQAWLDRTTIDVDESTWFSLFRRERWTDFEGMIPGSLGRKWHCASDDDIWDRLRPVLELANRYLFRALESEWLRALLDPRCMELVRDVWVGPKAKSNILRFKPRKDGLTYDEARAIFEHITKDRIYWAVHDKDHAVTNHGAAVCAYCVNVDENRSWISVDTRVFRQLLDPVCKQPRFWAAHNSITVFCAAQLVCSYLILLPFLTAIF